VTHLEAFYAMLTRQRPARLLYHASFTSDLQKRLQEYLGVSNLAAYFDYQWQEEVRMKPGAPIAFDLERYYPAGSLPAGTTIDDFGVAHIPGGYYHFTKICSPLRNATSYADIVTYPIDTASNWSDADMAAQVRQIHARGKVAVSWIGHMYETAWSIRGYEEFLVDLLERPMWAESILDRLTEANMVRAVAAAKAGVDYLRTGDDVANQNNMMFHPDLWRYFMKSRWQQVFAAARAVKPDIQIWYHSDGNIEAIIPEFIEIGVTILNPVQPECLDPMMVKRYYGDRLIIDGAIGTQSTMPWSSPQEVLQVVRQRKQALGYDGGYIIAPTHVLEPEVPIENVLAFFSACQEPM
jgi:uroporphyrinogen decarboxylase